MKEERYGYARSILEPDGVMEEKRGQDIKGHQVPDVLLTPDLVVGHGSCISNEDNARTPGKRGGRDCRTQTRV